jgi:hypothetical protein
MTTYQTPHPVRLRLKLEAGRIDVITWDEPRAEVEVTPLGDDQASVDAAQNVQQELRGSGESQELSVEAPSGRSLFGLRRGPELRFAISVPHGSSIDSTTVSADVAGRGRFGTAKVNTTSGDVSLGSVAGDATVKTVSGDLDVERVDGAASLSSVSGGRDLGQHGLGRPARDVGRLLGERQGRLRRRHRPERAPRRGPAAVGIRRHHAGRGGRRPRVDGRQLDERPHPVRPGAGRHRRRRRCRPAHQGQLGQRRHPPAAGRPCGLRLDG